MCGGYDAIAEDCRSICYSFDGTNVADQSWKPFEEMSVTRAKFAIAQLSPTDFVVIGESL